MADWPFATFSAPSLSWRNSAAFTRKRFVVSKPSRSTSSVPATTSKVNVGESESWRRSWRRWKRKTSFWSGVERRCRRRPRRRRKTTRADARRFWIRPSSSSATAKSRRLSSNEMWSEFYRLILIRWLHDFSLLKTAVFPNDNFAVLTSLVYLISRYSFLRATTIDLLIVTCSKSSAIFACHCLFSLFRKNFWSMINMFLRIYVFN